MVLRRFHCGIALTARVASPLHKNRIAFHFKIAAFTQRRSSPSIHQPRYQPLQTMSSNFRLLSKDGETIEMSAEALQQSITLRTMVEDTDLTAETPIPIGEIDAATARKIVAWCEKHKADPVPEPEVHEPGPKPSPPPFDMPRWDREFLNKDTLSIPEMAELIKAANYLEVPWLYKYCCKRIFMDYIKDRPVDQLKAMFEPRTQN